MVTIKKIKLKDLPDFVRSEEFSGFTNKPISVLRVASYINNPNKDGNDYVLYLAKINNQLVGYRTLFADTFTLDGTKKKFAWLSGNWVHKDHRRKGISSLLFQEVYKDWKGQLMYTNYAEASKAVYDKTTQFDLLHTLQGKRFYRRFCTADLLPNKAVFFKWIKPVLNLFDGVFNLFFDIRFSKKAIISEGYSIRPIEKWNETHSTFLTKFKKEELFKRDQKTYSWIQDFPWVKTDEETHIASKNYHFSSYAKKYLANFYEVLDSKTDQLIAILHISIKDKHLKIPYLYSDPAHSNAISKIIIHYAKNHRVNYLTCYHTHLIDRLQNHGNFLLSKQFEQNYFATKEILDQFPKIKNLKIQTGDGDGVFT